MRYTEDLKEWAADFKPGHLQKYKLYLYTYELNACQPITPIYVRGLLPFGELLWTAADVYFGRDNWYQSKSEEPSMFNLAGWVAKHKVTGALLSLTSEPPDGFLWKG
jgi:hypothetical protein